jgi:enamine deaminase RidA (YjgF/YER057c/UK114 family)
MRLLFNEYVLQLMQEDATLAANCIRTWIFVNDIDINYQGVVRARNQVFFTQGLTRDTHFVASTGIGGRGAAQEVLVQMDNYAVGGLQSGQVTHLYAPHRLNRTSDYGVSFERGTCVDYGDRRHVFISGTASINNKGEVVYQRDVVSQTHHMLGNVEALLNEAGCTFDDATHLIVYLRDLTDYPLVSAIITERFPQHPCIFVQAPVCRPAWLVEMECMAVRPAANAEWAPL